MEYDAIFIFEILQEILNNNTRTLLILSKTVLCWKNVCTINHNVQICGSKWWINPINLYRIPLLFIVKSVKAFRDSKRIIKPFSSKSWSVQIGSTAAGHLGQNSTAHVAGSSRSDLDAAPLKWNPLKYPMLFCNL